MCRVKGRESVPEKAVPKMARAVMMLVECMFAIFCLLSLIADR